MDNNDVTLNDENECDVRNYSNFSHPRLVVVDMRKASHQFVHLFYKISGVLCVDYKNKKCSLTKLSFIFGGLIQLLLISIVTYFISDPILMVNVYKNIIINLQGYSTFSMILLYSATHIMNLLAFSLVATQIFQREKIKKFIENVIDKLEASKFRDELESAVFTNCAILFIYFWVIYVLQLAVAMKVSLVSILGGFFIIYPYFVFFGFLSLVRNFEALVVTLLKDFELKLNHNSMMKSSDCCKLLQEYQNIFSLSDEFNKLFGAQLTMLFCSVTLLFTFQVITKNWKLKILLTDLLSAF